MATINQKSFFCLIILFAEIASKKDHAKKEAAQTQSMENNTSGRKGLVAEIKARYTRADTIEGLGSVD